MTIAQFNKITLQNCQNETVCLDNFKGQYIVLYFYPKDDTSGCTQEGKDFNELLTQFKKLNAVIIGVSKDTVACHIKFKDKYQFNFELLADVEQKLCQAFDVIKEKSMYGKKYLGIERSTFLINPNGKVIKEWRKVTVTDHAAEVLATLKETYKE